MDDHNRINVSTTQTHGDKIHINVNRNILLTFIVCARTCFFFGINMCDGKHNYSEKQTNFRQHFLNFFMESLFEVSKFLRSIQ